MIYQRHIKVIDTTAIHMHAMLMYIRHNHASEAGDEHHHISQIKFTQ